MTMAENSKPFSLDGFRYYIGNPSAWREGYDDDVSEWMRAAGNHIEWLHATLVQIGILNASGPHPDPEIDRVIREAAREIVS